MNVITELELSAQDLIIASDKMPHISIQDAARHYKKMRDYLDSIASVVKVLQACIDHARHETLPNIFRDNNVTSISVDGYRFTISQTVRASIPGETKPQAYQWLRDNELSELIIETVNSSTLASQAKALMEDGKELDPDLFKIAIVPNVSITKT